jgi:hypothetical protein
MAPRRGTRSTEIDPTQRPGYIAFGSPEHRAILGVDAPGLKPDRKAELEAQLKSVPTVSVDPERKVPITRDNFVATTRSGMGDEIIDGWTRKGGGNR